MKMLFAEAQAIICASTNLLQAGLLIAAYEYANGRPEAANITMGTLARTAFAIGLANPSSWQTNEASNISLERLERLNLWWGVIILERLILCEIKDKTQRPTTECPSSKFPLPSDLQPIQASHQSVGSSSHENLPSNQDRKPCVFGHQARAVLLLDRVLAVRRLPQADSGRTVEIRQLDEQLQSFLSERINTATAEIGHDCSPIASAVRALCLLHQEVIESPSNTVDLQSLQYSQAALGMSVNRKTDARSVKMKGAALIPLAAGIPFAHGLSLHKRDGPAVVRMPIERRSAQSLQKRDSTVGVTLQNWDATYYAVNLTLGTPAQKVSLALDTGSSDLWVNTGNSTYCSIDNLCTPYGLYNASESSTVKTVGTHLNDTYADGTNLYGPYVTDKLTIGNTTIDNMQFGIAESTTSKRGIAGVGYKISTYQAEHDDKVYANLPQALVDSGAIKSAAYSIWLDSLEASTGSLLFGGVNTAKYKGDLQTLPIIPVYGKYYSLAIALTELSVATDSNSSSFTDSLPLSVSLDTGTTMTALPSDLVNKVYDALNATYDKTYDMAYIDCDTREADYNVTYSFSGATITVSMSELIIPATEPGWPDNTCVLGLVPSQPGVNLLGDTFLRSAYVVYDLENNEISLANTNFNPGDDDILEIGTGTSAVPGATPVPSAVSSATGNGLISSGTAVPTLSGVTITATATATGSTGTGSSGGSSAEATSTSSEGAAAQATSNPMNLLPGLAGIGLLLAL
ncbi:hypothetical protein CBS115989_5621 [Aspergillus niger]|nr:hypothetical protein CBS115989_5621 [Aspergillus niger]KAI2831625.1 hypothetical protein CBS133816_2217 [Aspergillus niger]KAI2853389.1 hypothetical protein CBS11350_127 [Aspergillus niger]KAI2861381.1 hypothetical protein CBS11232_1017 [Aspergillus niger]KAI2875229.1 hypothetical protein CBS115988_5547 [Aspergillus niger]